MKIEADLDDLNVLFDVHDAGETAELIGHQNISVAESVIVVFDVHRPMPRKGPIDAASGNPAVAIVCPLEVERSAAVESAAADIVLVAGNRKAAAGINE